MAAHPNYVTIPAVFIPRKSREPDMALEPRYESEGQAATLPEKPTYDVEIDYAGNWIIKGVTVLMPRPAPPTEPPSGPVLYPHPKETGPRPDYLRRGPPPKPRRADKPPDFRAGLALSRGMNVGMDLCTPEGTRNLMRQTTRIMADMERFSGPVTYPTMHTPEALSAAVHAGMQHLAAHKGDVVTAIASIKAAGTGWRDSVPEVAVPANMAMVSRTAPHINIEADLAGSLIPLTSDFTSGVSEQSGGSSHLVHGVQTVAAEEEDEPGDDELDPFAEVRTQEFFSMQEQLAHIAPGSPYAASISRPGWVPSQQDVDDMIDALNTAIDEVASEIASGHASGGRIDYEFEALINSTIRNPTEFDIMPNGRIWYYNKSQKFFVVINPGDPDGGSAYPVSDWPK
jgi:hypothetical protein